MNPEHITAQILLRTWPFPRGAGRLIDTFFARARFSKDMATVKTTDGFSISVSPNDLIGRHIYLTGEFDRSIVELLCRFSQPGDTLLDIGANIGYVSSCFLANVANSRVVAVEPQPDVVKLLNENLGQFDSGRYQIVPSALSNETRKGWLLPCDENPGAGRIAEESAGAVAVDIISAADLFNLAKIEKLDIVKIDVEGHEEKVISACAEQFKRLRPRAILFECESSLASLDAPIGSILGAIGYDIFGIKKRLTRIDLPKITRSIDCIFNDYIALRRSN